MPSTTGSPSGHRVRRTTHDRWYAARISGALKAPTDGIVATVTVGVRPFSTNASKEDTMRIALVDLEVLVRNWWVVLLRGLAGMLFGIMTFVAPGLSLAALVLLFGAYAFADGVLAIVAAVRRRAAAGTSWWMLVVQGIAGMAAGAATLLWPGITALVLLYLIAGWALVTGVFEVVAAIRLRQVLTHEWLLALSGLASIGLGILLMVYPGAGALAVVLWIGAYALVSGALLFALAIKLRAFGRHHQASHEAPAHA